MVGTTTSTIVDTAGICITKAMSGPLIGSTAEAAAKPWLIPAGKYFAAHHLQGQHPLQVVLPLRLVSERRRQHWWWRSPVSGVWLLLATS